ncbi:PfkB family carbohydrate kinase [Labrys okinawensis]|uniref:PfkB family carbohydrate kinase n=1 Tax=Labrys okinawensis TaxID=346911 RepID=UPI0039BCF253
MKKVLTIGDAIIDAVEQPDGSFRTYAGGAGLNLAVGLARLGLDSALLSRVGADRWGYRLLRYLRDRHVRLINTPNVDSTGSATSRRVHGEPSYIFSGDLRRRRYIIGPEARAVLDQAAAVAVNSYPFENAAHAADLAARLAAAPGLVFIDPNPRLDLINDIRPVREGIAEVVGHADLVKLSEEDATLIFGTTGREAVNALFGWSVDTIVLTQGRKGATLFSRSGLMVKVPVSQCDQPVVDTMGAGDATLASLIASCLERGMPRDAEGWGACLERAMQVAAATCRSEGGELALPKNTAGDELAGMGARL